MTDSTLDEPREAVGGQIKTLSKGLNLLDEIIDSAVPLKLADIVRRFDMDRASAFRFLQTLEKAGFLRKDNITKEYDVGGRLFFWASRLREKNRLINTFHETLQELADAVQQTSHLGLFMKNRVLLADFAHSSNLVSIRHKVGSFEPVYSSAAGKAILAFLPQALQDEIIDNLTFEKFTKDTIVAKEPLRINLALTRERGYAIDENETHEGLTCVARPLFNVHGEPVASIGITVVTAIVSAQPGRFEKIIGELKRVKTSLVGETILHREVA